MLVFVIRVNKHLMKFKKKFDYIFVLNCYSIKDRTGSQCREHYGPICKCENGGECIEKRSGQLKCECKPGYG
jgi:hypothetical protein